MRPYSRRLFRLLAGLALLVIAASAPSQDGGAERSIPSGWDVTARVRTRNGGSARLLGDQEIKDFFQIRNSRLLTDHYVIVGIPPTSYPSRVDVSFLLYLPGLPEGKERIPPITQSHRIKNCDPNDDQLFFLRLEDESNIIARRRVPRDVGEVIVLLDSVEVSDDLTTGTVYTEFGTDASQSSVRVMTGSQVAASLNLKNTSSRLYAVGGFVLPVVGNWDAKVSIYDGDGKQIGFQYCRRVPGTYVRPYIIPLDSSTVSNESIRATVTTLAPL